ncbi:hypothetical protein CCU68_33320 [Pseudomonas gingeri NCPPB 3146 = LMG 5327]|uniref:Transposase n=1 Tax=Pseudomonas gingeri NCPPB 3146 = LMG 5327 TaxID=707248 RepID=A0ABX4XTH2_9PSED|nr:hypothetical protein CCU68_33320 [Pseudomonas gingeri NCPPB 3146 = LMG 5327]
MYSYEDRIRAVKLYIKLGKRTGATIHQLGYPTKNSLKSWHEEYERCLDPFTHFSLIEICPPRPVSKRFSLHVLGWCRP